MIEMSDARLGLIARLASEGHASVERIAFYTNRGDDAGLTAYINSCISLKYKELVEADLKQADEMQAAIARRWVEDAFASAGGDRDLARKKLASLQGIFESLGMIEHIRAAWKKMKR